MGTVRPVECQGILRPQPHWGNGSKDLRASPPSLGPCAEQCPCPSSAVQDPFLTGGHPHSEARPSLQALWTSSSPGRNCPCPPCWLRPPLAPALLWEGGKQPKKELCIGVGRVCEWFGGWSAGGQGKGRGHSEHRAPEKRGCLLSARVVLRMSRTEPG